MFTCVLRKLALNYLPKFGKGQYLLAEIAMRKKHQEQNYITNKLIHC